MFKVKSNKSFKTLQTCTNLTHLIV